MNDQITDQSVVVSQESFESDEDYDIIESNISFVNALFDANLEAEEIPKDALRSYYVDYYLTQINNGGFSQFVYNSRWTPQIVSLIKEGLEAMGALRHLAHFKKCEELFLSLGEKGIKRFFSSDFFNINRERDLLNSLDAAFYNFSEREDLVELNHRWLHKRPHLVVMTPVQMKEEVKRRAAAIPDHAEREAEATEADPRHLKLIRALCKEAGHEFSCITAGDPTHMFQEQQILAWHFITDRGHHYMLDLDEKAMMFSGTNDKLVMEIEVTEEFGPFAPYGLEKKKWWKFWE